MEKHIGDTIRNYRPGIEELAVRLGRSASLLYRAANPNDETGLSALLIPTLIETTRDYRIIRYLARRFGFILIRAPRAPKKISARTVLDIQKTLNETTNVLIRRVDGAVTRSEAVDSLWKSIEELAGVIKQLESENTLMLEEAGQSCLKF